MSEAEWKQLRGGCKAKLTRFKKFIDKLTSGSDNPVLNEIQIAELEGRLERTLPILTDFEKCQNNLNLLVSEEDADYSQLDDFESSYQQYVAIAKTLLKGSEPTRSPRGSQESLNSFYSAPPRHPPSRYTSVKLPTIELPTFSGESTTWLAFRDMFETLIDQNKELSDVQKFSYLRSALSGKARDIIASLPTPTMQLLGVL